MCTGPPHQPPHNPPRESSAQSSAHSSTQSFAHNARTHFFHACRFTRVTKSTRVDVTCGNFHACRSTRVEISTRVDLHAWKFPHVTSTRVDFVTRVNLHAWKKWVRAWRGGLCEGSGRIVKSVPHKKSYFCAPGLRGIWCMVHRGHRFFAGSGKPHCFEHKRQARAIVFISTPFDCASERQCSVHMSSFQIVQTSD